MADPRTESEIALSPDEEARLLAAVRRAEEDRAAGRVYRTSEEGLRELVRIWEGLREEDDRNPGPPPSEALMLDQLLELIEEAIKAGIVKPEQADHPPAP